ncbi:MAG: RNA methyltransferase [Caldilineaceae bacterium SB0664_bin_22]|nr:RNA methyltransferase [Caldilineaceae bacterium SB0664_bin_22]
MSDTGHGHISSTRNPRIRHALRLRQSAYRRAHRQTLAEGYREIEAVLRNGVPIQTVFVCEELLLSPEGTELAARLQSRTQTSGGRFHTVSRHVYGRLAMRASVGGLLVEIKPPVHSLRGLVPHPNERLVVLEDVDKPGNIGAVLRTMRAAGSSTLILATHGRGGTDLMNPNVIRASVGLCFDLRCVEAPVEEVVGWLNRQQCTVLAVSPEGRSLYRTDGLPGTVACVFGSEATGLSPIWRDVAHAVAAIPMTPGMDSLNLSVSVAVVLYELLRRGLSEPN